MNDLLSVASTFQAQIGDCVNTQAPFHSPMDNCSSTSSSALPQISECLTTQPSFHSTMLSDCMRPSSPNHTSTLYSPLHDQDKTNISLKTSRKDLINSQINSFSAKRDFLDIASFPLQTQSVGRRSLQTSKNDSFVDKNPAPTNMLALNFPNISSSQNPLTSQVDSRTSFNSPIDFNTQMDYSDDLMVDCIKPTIKVVNSEQNTSNELQEKLLICSTTDILPKNVSVASNNDNFTYTPVIPESVLEDKCFVQENNPLKVTDPVINPTPGLDSILLNIDSISIPSPLAVIAAVKMENKKSKNNGIASDEGSQSETSDVEDTNGTTNKDKKKKDKKRKLNSERKNIRKIKDDGLNVEVKEAQRAELERLKRISEKEDSLEAAQVHPISPIEASISTEDKTLAEPSGQDQHQSSAPDHQLSPSSPKQSRLQFSFNSEQTPPALLTIPTPITQHLKQLFSSSLLTGEDRTSPQMTPIYYRDDEEPSDEDSMSSLMPSGRTVRDAIVLEDSSDDETDNEKTAQIPKDGIERDSLGRVLVNRKHPNDEEDCFLSTQVARVIKPHQIEGIRFLYNNVVESVKQFSSSPGFGCILAHSMGLGKTIQVVAFLDVLFRHVGARSAVVIVPINTIANWQSEVEMWLPKEPIADDYTDTGTIRRPFTLFVINENQKSIEARHQTISSWEKTGGVLLIGYEMFRLLVSKKVPKRGSAGSVGSRSSANSQSKPICIDVDAEEKKDAIRRELYAALVDPGPQVVICDEGHRIKNSEASISKALKSLKTKRRVVMTGYPLQNNLLEYWCMVDFVRPSYLGSKSDFTNMFQRPIENGQCVDSTEVDRKLMQGRAHVLHELLSGFVQRRSQAVLKASLPDKLEYVLYIKMSPTQRALYSAMITGLRQEAEGGGSMISSWAQSSTLKTYAVCCKIWNHPDILWRAVQEQHRVVDPFDFDIDDDNAGASTGSPGGASSSRGGKRGKRKQPGGMTPVSSNASLASMASLASNQDLTSSVSELPPPTSTGISYEWTEKAGVWATYKPGLAEYGGKIPVLLSIIEATMLAGDKLLIFSQSLLALDIMEMFLRKTPIPNPITKVEDGAASSVPQFWVKNETYYRLDGSTNSTERERLINGFNSTQGKAKVFLLSTRAGCLGINLIGANRVVVFDASWNPCHDGQAVCRVYRYGQVKPCFIYRLVTDNTMEKKIFDRQVTKQGMSDRVVDELNPDQQFTRQQVDQLMDYEDKELPSLSRQELEKEGLSELEDWVLQATLVNNAHWITKMPFTHESLLIDRKDYQLTRAEKRLAKQSYEEEKMKGSGGGGNQRMGFRPPDYFHQNDPLSFGSSFGYPSLPHSRYGGLMRSASMNGNLLDSPMDLLTSYPDPWAPSPPTVSSRPPISSSRSVKRVQASGDFYLTTSSKGPDGRPISRKILRGDTLEIYKTGKSGSWIRLAKTGEVFPSRPAVSSGHSNSNQSSGPPLVLPPRSSHHLQEPSTGLSLSDLLNTGSEDMFSQPGSSSRQLACCGCDRHTESVLTTSGCICVCHAPGANFGSSSGINPSGEANNEDINFLLGLEPAPPGLLEDSTLDEDLYNLWSSSSYNAPNEDDNLPPPPLSFMDVDF